MAKGNKQELSETPVIVHLGTKIEVRFGYLDEGGNVIPQEPLFLNVAGLSEEAFAEVRNQIEVRREALREAIAKSLAEKDL